MGTLAAASDRRTVPNVTPAELRNSIIMGMISLIHNLASQAASLNELDYQHHKILESFFHTSLAIVQLSFILAYQ